MLSVIMLQLSAVDLSETYHVISCQITRIGEGGCG